MKTAKKYPPETRPAHRSPARVLHCCAHNWWLPAPAESPALDALGRAEKRAEQLGNGNGIAWHTKQVRLAAWSPFSDAATIL